MHAASRARNERSDARKPAHCVGDESKSGQNMMGMGRVLIETFVTTRNSKKLRQQAEKSGVKENTH
jgi:hypothetical protein